MRRAPRAAKGVAYAAMGLGIGSTVYAVYDPALHPLLGTTLLVSGFLTLAMMTKTREIRDRLYEKMDELNKKADEQLKKADEQLEKTDEVLMAIMGPPKTDENGEPVKRDYSKHNLLKAIEDGNDKLMKKMDEGNDKLMKKMDEVVESIDRLSNSVRDLARGKQGREASARRPELSALAEGGPSRVGGAETGPLLRPGRGTSSTA